MTHKERCLKALEHFEQTGEQPEPDIPKPKRQRGRPRRDLTNEQIGRWLVCEYAPKTEIDAMGKRRIRSGWFCVCQCPAHTEQWVATDALLLERSMGCRKCRTYKRRKIDPQRRRSLEYLKRTDPESLRQNLRPFEYEIIFGEPRSPEEHAAYLERQKEENQNHVKTTR